MNTSNYWVRYFKVNARELRINWEQSPQITPDETAAIIKSLQAWQLGETSEARQLIASVTKYARKTNDPDYLEAMLLFIKEEQKHGNNLGRYLDSIRQPRIGHDWGDSLFRRFRHLNSSMEMWIVTVLIIESIAQLFYQSLKDATNCPLLREICDDILTDEARHIDFQTERLAIIYSTKSAFSHAWRKKAYKCYFYGTASVVWLIHGRAFKAGGLYRSAYIKKMRVKYDKTLAVITSAAMAQLA